MTWSLTGVPSWSLLKFLINNTHCLELVIFQVAKPVGFYHKQNILRTSWHLAQFFRQKLVANVFSTFAPKRLRIITTREINSDQSIKAALETSESQYLFVRGGKIIEEGIIEMFRGNWINIHGGFLPEYRGLDSHLWAASEGNYHLIGATAHVLVRQIDNGEILQRLTLEGAEKMGWFRMGKAVKDLENKLHKWMLDELIENKKPIQTMVLNYPSGGSYYSAYPRRFGLFPDLKRKRETC